jgi:hypothetical protein
MRCTYHLLTGLILTSFIIAQPKISGRLGIGYSSPDYKTFAESPFPKKGTFENMMVNFSFLSQVTIMKGKISAALLITGQWLLKHIFSRAENWKLISH